MTAGLDRARQLQVALDAVEEGMLDSWTALRAVSQWLSNDSLSLVEVLLVQPELNDDSKQSLRERFETATQTAMEQPTTSLAAVQGKSQLRRLQAFLAEPDSVVAPEVSTQDLSLGTDDTPANNDTTESYAPGKPMAAAAVLGGKLPDTPRPANFATEQFRVLSEFARGGLGVLYLAQDKRLQRRVIVKKIRREHSASNAARQKFILEAEVTGQLEHPGIVPIYALGTDNLSEPYYAMRLIEGKNLLVAINEIHAARSKSERFYDGLRFRELLQRFIDVCHALHYAHSRGIIHRDLKPANIMLGEHGETLVIDWGMAKSLAAIGQTQVENETAAALTSAPVQVSGRQDPSIEGSFGGTARYAPPEQLAGQIDQLGPACDIYSLGAILVEILCQGPALDGKIENPRAALKRLEAGQLRVPRQIVADVPKPLNAICAKAMALKVSDRYPTALALAEDVQRWLADEFVLAYRHQETQPERLGRWLRHHRSWAAGLALSLVALTASALVANVLINRARLNERTAKRQAIEFKEDALSRYRAAKAAIDSLMDRSDHLQDIQGTAAIRSQLLQAAADKYAELSQATSLDPELEIERARSMVRLADAFMLQNETDKAFQQYDHVIEWLASPAQPSDRSDRLSNTSLLQQVELARALTRRGTAHWNLQQIEPARSDLQRSIAMLEELQSQNATALPVLGNLAIARLNLGSLEEEHHRDEVALELARQALDPFQDPQLTSERRFALARVRIHQLLERLLRKQGQRERALEQLALADAQLAQLLVREPRDPQCLESRAALWVTAAINARQQGDCLAAIADLQRALEIYDRLSAAWPGSSNYAYGAAICQFDLAAIHDEIERHTEGEQFLDAAKRTFASLEDTLNREQLALHHANTLDLSGKYLMARMTETSSPGEETVDQFHKGIELAQALIERLDARQEPLTMPRLSQARIQSHLAQFYARQQRWPEARTAFEAARRNIDACEPPDSPSIAELKANTIWYQALMEHAAQETKQAETHFEEVLKLSQLLVQVDPTPQHRYELARFYVRCPLPAFRNRILGLEQTQLCLQAVPDNPLYIKLLADAQAMNP